MQYIRKSEADATYGTADRPDGQHAEKIGRAI